MPRSTSDIFISYSRADNECKWVTLLKNTLERVFKSMNRDEHLTFYFDIHSNYANDPLDDSMRESVQASGVLLIVMSGNWCDSSYCLRELEWFIEAAGGIDKARQRIFIVLPTPLGVMCWPKSLRQNVAKEFYERNDETGEFEQISWDFEHSGKPPSECTRLAKELWACLEGLGRVLPPKSEKLRTISVQSLATHAAVQLSGSVTNSCAVRSNSSSVFVAEAHRELSEVRNKLCEELRREGYQVLPVDREFRKDRVAAEQEVPPLLHQAKLIVQLYHEKPVVTEDFEDGFDQWLTGQVAALGKSSNASSIRWRRRGLSAATIKNETHRQLVFEPDVIEVDEALLTNLVLERIKAIEQSEKIDVSAGAGRKILIRTKDAWRPLADELCDHIESFCIPEISASLQADIVREDVSFSDMDRELKATSNSVVGLFVIYADDDESWAQEKMRECRTIAMRRRPKLPVTAVYVKPIDDVPRPRAIPGRFEVLRTDDSDKLQQVLKQALEVKS